MLVVGHLSCYHCFWVGVWALFRKVGCLVWLVKEIDISFNTAQTYLHRHPAHQMRQFSAWRETQEWLKLKSAKSQSQPPDEVAGPDEQRPDREDLRKLISLMRHTNSKRRGAHRPARIVFGLSVISVILAYLHVICNYVVVSTTARRSAWRSAATARRTARTRSPNDRTHGCQGGVSCDEINRVRAFARFVNTVRVHRLQGLAA